MENGCEITYCGRGGRGCMYWSKMDVGAGTGVGGGHQSDLEPEGDDRESVLAVGRELKHFGRKRIDTCGEIFIVLKHINTSSN
jgi:hypothetical protein